MEDFLELLRNAPEPLNYVAGLGLAVIGIISFIKSKRKKK